MTEYKMIESTVVNAGLLLAIFLFCFLNSGVIGCTDDWPMYQPDPQYTGFSSSGMPAHLREAWKYKEYEVREARIAALIEGKLFVADHYIIYPLESNGSLDWSYEFGRKSKWLFAPPTAADNRVYTGAPTKILCLDATRGSLL
ncbi:MAG: PQQ-like beta-propeller repeat protein [Theionarchaea archaeon]|nr:PQQ-like beta-propeller repeat protein [Theionarchaea archaeon]